MLHMTIQTPVGPPQHPALIAHERPARREHPEPRGRPHHDVRGIDGVRLHPHVVVRGVDRLPRREVPVRIAHDDRVARGDLPVDVRDDQPEPGRREAPGAGRPPVGHRADRGEAERGPARHLEADPRADPGDPRSSRRRWPAGPLRRRATLPRNAVHDVPRAAFDRRDRGLWRGAAPGGFAASRCSTASSFVRVDAV